MRTKKKRKEAKVPRRNRKKANLAKSLSRRRRTSSEGESAGEAESFGTNDVETEPFEEEEGGETTVD